MLTFFFFLAPLGHSERLRISRVIHHASATICGGSLAGGEKNGVTKHRWSGYRPANQDEGVRGGFVRFKALALDFECTLSQDTSTFD